MPAERPISGLDLARASADEVLARFEHTHAVFAAAWSLPRAGAPAPWHGPPV